jgi:hypothetical protein
MSISSCPGPSPEDSCNNDPILYSWISIEFVFPLRFEWIGIWETAERDDSGCFTYVEGRDGAGGVAWDVLHLDAELAVEVLVLGVEAAAGVPVEDERRYLLARAVVIHADGAVRGELLVQPRLRRCGGQERQGDGNEQRQTPLRHGGRVDLCGDCALLLGAPMRS